MIAYLDTSALVPLLVDEPSSPACERLWNEADEIVSGRIAYVEAAAALAQARRSGRLSPHSQRAATVSLDGKWQQMQIVEVDQLLMNRAAALADTHGLRGYDATHCAAAESINDDALVAASGDAALLAAWRALGMNTLATNS